MNKKDRKRMMRQTDRDIHVSEIKEVVFYTVIATIFSTGSMMILIGMLMNVIG